MCRTKMYNKTLNFPLFRWGVLMVSGTFQNVFLQISLFRFYFSSSNLGAYDS